MGAGSVGQVLGHYLHAAGCAVSYLVKPKHADPARAGFSLYELGVRERTPAPTPLVPESVLVSEREAVKRPWEQVWLCTASPALRSGDWVKTLARGTGDATWVMLQPALDDREWLLNVLPPERLVTGMIPFLAFQAPLVPGDALAGPGTAFWMPPLVQGLFSGPPERLRPLVGLLRAAGYPAREDADVTRSASIPSAMLCAAVLGLEAEDWRFERLLRPEALARTLGAAREAARIAEWATGANPSPVLSLLRPLVLKAGLALATRLAPVDLETYLRVHFTKVGEQTRLMLRTYLSMARSAGLDVPHLQALAPAEPAAAPDAPRARR